MGGLGDAHIKDEGHHDSGHDPHDAPHLLDEELFGDDLLTHGYPHPHHSSHPDMPPPSSNAAPSSGGKPPRPRIRVTLKADSPPPNGRGLRGNAGAVTGAGSNNTNNNRLGNAGGAMGGNNVNIIARSTSRSKLSEGDATMRASGGLYHYPSPSPPPPSSQSSPANNPSGSTPTSNNTRPNPSMMSSNNNPSYPSSYASTLPPAYPHPHPHPYPNTSNNSAAYPNAIYASSTSPPYPHPTAQPISALNSSTIVLQGGEKRVGAYSVHERRMKIDKFRERKRARIWRKQIKYDCRKRLADTRPR